MKQIYTMPTTAVTTIELHQIMAGSFTRNGSGEVTGGSLQGIDATGSAMSRHKSYWDDDED